MAQDDIAVAPAEDSGDSAIAPDAEPGARARSRLVGDMPDHVGQRYFIEERGLRREQRLFETAHDAAPTIRDLGHRLIVATESAAVVRDLLDIAQHRGWARIDVSGSDRFHRMVEQEAREHGVDVAHPRSHDGRSAVNGTHSSQRKPVEKQRSPGDFRAGVTGIILETGEAPFNGRPGQRPSPYIDLQLGDGRIRRAWGAGLPAALARERIEVGDSILLREDGTERAEGSKRPRKRWVADRQAEQGREKPAAPVEREEAAPKARDRSGSLPLSERFRRGSPRERADDPDLRAAQSQLIAARALASAYLAHNPVSAALVASRLEGMIASSLDKGRRFSVARTRERADGRHELVLERGTDRDRPVSAAKAERHPEITKVRDRGRRR
ncbi:LPD7 domain-containing protein [Sphingomonas sp. SRS2]|uniref:LPD7 domain-containing protein n=1 Tax=Sphingomonas sp. SRS2 TaxID=133190 RepID=UPI000697DFA9|nr:LPD7 domain-containing protein [Sphingomonas sp. SRS2]